MEFAKKLSIHAAMLCFCALAGCRHEQQIINLPVVNCKVTYSADMYPDSSFFKDISCIQIDDKGRPYFFDRERGDVVSWDLNNANDFHIYGSVGQGPAELAYPTTFNILPDGKVVILDAGNRNLKIYNNNGFVEAKAVPCGGEERFFVHQDTVYLSSNSEYKDQLVVEIVSSEEMYICERR